MMGAKAPRRIRVLYAHASALVGGGNKVLLSLFAKIDRRRFELVSVIPEAGPIEANLRDLDIRYVVHDLRPQPTAIAAATRVLRFKWLFKRIDPGILHSNEVPYRLASLSTGGAARICHLHHPGLTAEGIKWLFGRPPHLVVTPSRYVQRLVQSAAADAALDVNVQVVSNPIDVDWFSPAQDRASLRNRIGLETDRPHVLIVGALAPHKGHATFIRMARVILNTMPDVRFHIVGGDLGRDGSHGRELRALVGELGVAHRVTFWGFLSDLAVRDLMSACDLFVLPTREEGFGLVVAEAQACAVPVLASAISPLDEVVADGKSGRLVESSEPHEWAAAASELLSTPTRMREMGEFGRRWVRGRFGADAYAVAMSALYEVLACSDRATN
jgi:glycosyltransferase involved in cell wall biosynthesis